MELRAMSEKTTTSNRSSVCPPDKSSCTNVRFFALDRSQHDRLWEIISSDKSKPTTEDSRK